MMCEYVEQSSYLVLHYGEKHENGAGVGLLHHRTMWAAHAPARPSDSTFLADQAYIDEVVVALTVAASSLAEAEVSSSPRRIPVERPLVWLYPVREEQRIEFARTCAALNTSCEDFRPQMDRKWSRSGPSLTPRARLLWFVCQAVFGCGVTSLVMQIV